MTPDTVRILGLAVMLVLNVAAARAADYSTFKRQGAPLPGAMEAYRARKALEAEAAEAMARQQAAIEAEARRQSLAASCPMAATPHVDPPGPPGSVFKDCPDCPEMVVIPAGSFMMGGTDYNDEKPVRRVTFRYTFALGRYEVTQAEWRAVMGDNPSGFKGDRKPVEQVSWDDVQEFIRCLNAGLQPPAQGVGPYRLPTEAEWEYAARAGSGGKYPWGNVVGSGNANCAGCGGPWAGKETAPVGRFPANAFGLHDMLGNVAEWIQDCYAFGYDGASLDGLARMGQAACYRVNRGGSWYDHPRDIRSASRSGDVSGYRNDNLGFRLARTLAPR